MIFGSFQSVLPSLTLLPRLLWLHCSRFSVAILTSAACKTRHKTPFSQHTQKESQNRFYGRCVPCMIIELCSPTGCLCGSESEFPHALLLLLPMSDYAHALITKDLAPPSPPKFILPPSPSAAELAIYDGWSVGK